MRRFAHELVTSLALGLFASPAAALTGERQCTAMKLKAAGKRYAGEMVCYAKAVASPAPDPLCLEKARQKYVTEFEVCGTCPPSCIPQ